MTHELCTNSDLFHCAFLQWLSSLAGYDERVSISQETGELILEAARARSLDGALLAKGTDVISALSYFLVLNPSGEKDNK